jgi:hypothetical protein
MSNPIGANMLLIQSDWNEDKTFKMIPLTNDCPYIETIYDPSTKVLVMISRVSMTKLHMLPKLDDNGDPAPLKVPRKNGRAVKEERRSIETFQEFYIDNADAIDAIVDIFAVNKDTFDYKQYIKK